MFAITLYIKYLMFAEYLSYPTCLTFLEPTTDHFTAIMHPPPDQLGTSGRQVYNKYFLHIVDE